MSYKCPDCGTILMYDYETSTEVIFYCINCNKNVKAKIHEINEKQFDKAIGKMKFNQIINEIRW